MTDEELIAGLRANALWVTTHDAANRIEQLLQSNEALLSLPAVYAHQINTGVREVMTAPDHIWAWTYKDCDWKSAWTVDDEDAPPHAVEYIRADLATPAAKTPEVRALVDAVESAWSHDGEPTNAEIAQILDALTALRAGGDA